MEQREHIRCLIIGSGPAGYTAAIYTCRANLKPVVYSGMQPGGQLTQTTVIENFPGFPEGITGTELMNNMKAQAERFGADIRPGRITKVDFSQRPLLLEIDGQKEVTADAVVVATGAAPRFLGLADEKTYWGEGVSACATCDGFFYRNQDVAVVGGGDTACEEASYLSSIARKVYLIVRKDYLRASKAMQERVLKNEKIEVLFEHNTVGLFGENGLEGAHLLYKMGTPQEAKRDIAITGFFLAIGHVPNTEVFKGQLELDEQGFIATKGQTPFTSVPGVFAAGDVADPRYRQAITSAGSGCKAASEVEHYLAELN